MADWWSYSLSDFLLFSPQTYYRLFERYNLAIWPLQLVWFGLAVVMLGLSRRRPDQAARLTGAVLAAAWLWIAWAFHLERFASINWAAVYFAAGFAVEAALLLWLGVVRRQLAVESATSRVDLAALAIVVFAVFGYPLIGPLFGRPWTQAEVFGVAPDPTVIATLGMLLLARRPAWPLLVVPFLWCVISGATLWTMKSPDAMVLPTLASLLLLLAIAKTMRRRG